MYLTIPSRIPQIDAYAARELKIPVIRLMGNAGRAFADAIAERVAVGSRVLILAGPGNNGGDGYAAALRLAECGYETKVIELLAESHKSAATMYYAALYSRSGGAKVAYGDLADGELDELLCSATAIVDAIFGTGARLELPEEIRELLTRIRDLENPPLRVAADLPTGVDGDSGRVGDICFTADLTVCFAVGKRGMYAYPAREHCGEIIISDIGIDSELLKKNFPSSDRLLDRALAASLLPRRARNTHKGSFGRLLMLAGSRAYRGAALLAGEAALRSGAGIVTLASHESVTELAVGRFPEMIVMPTQELDRLDREHTKALYEAAERASCILIGPGSGVSNSLCCLIWELMNRPGAPLVVDADGLNSLAMHHSETLSRLKNAKRTVILTPHPLELARLAALTVQDVQSDRIGTVLRFAKASHATVVLKGAGTLIASSDGSLSLNSSGSPALSKAGSGDVLAGSIAAFLAQGISAHDAASLAVYLHGAAGDRLAESYSEYGVLSAQIPEQIARELRSLERMRDGEAQ